MGDKFLVDSAVCWEELGESGGVPTASLGEVDTRSVPSKLGLQSAFCPPSPSAPFADIDQ